MGDGVTDARQDLGIFKTSFFFFFFKRLHKDFSLFFF